MTVREALKQIEEKVERRTRLKAQRDATEDDHLFRQHANMWIDEVSNQIDKVEDELSDEFGRLQARIAALESSAQLVDIGHEPNLSEMGR